MKCRICEKESIGGLCPGCRELDEAFKRAEEAERQYLAFRKVMRDL